MCVDRDGLARVLPERKPLHLLVPWLTLLEAGLIKVPDAALRSLS